MFNPLAQPRMAHSPEGAQHTTKTASALGLDFELETPSPRLGQFSYTGWNREIHSMPGFPASAENPVWEHWKVGSLEPQGTSICIKLAQRWLLICYSRYKVGLCRRSVARQAFRAPLSHVFKDSLIA